MIWTAQFEDEFPGVCSFRWNLALFHRAGFHTSIVMLCEKQSRRTRICTLTNKTSTPQLEAFELTIGGVLVVRSPGCFKQWMQSTLTSLIYPQMSEINEIFEKKPKNFHVGHLWINYRRCPKPRPRVGNWSSNWAVQEAELSWVVTLTDGRPINWLIIHISLITKATTTHETKELIP